MTRWEYRTVSIPLEVDHHVDPATGLPTTGTPPTRFDERLQAVLAEHGQAGWELVNFQIVTLATAWVAVFKRPV